MAEATLLGQNSGSSGSSDNESIYERPVSFDFEDAPYKRNILNTVTLISGNSDTYTQIGSVSFTFNSAESTADDDNVYLRIEGNNTSVLGKSEKAYLYCKSTTGAQYILISIISLLSTNSSYNTERWRYIQYFKIPKTSLTDGNTYNLYIKTTSDEYGDDFSARIKSIDYLYNIILSNIVDYRTFLKDNYYKFFWEKIQNDQNVISNAYSNLYSGNGDVLGAPINNTIIFVTKGIHKFGSGLLYNNSSDSKINAIFYLYPVNKIESQETEKVIKNSVKAKVDISEYYPSSKMSYNRIFYPFDHYINQDKIIELTGKATLLAPSGLIYNYNTVVQNYYSIEKSFLELN